MKTTPSYQYSHPFAEKGVPRPAESYRAARRNYDRGSMWASVDISGRKTYVSRMPGKRYPYASKKRGGLS